VGEDVVEGVLDRVPDVFGALEEFETVESLSWLGRHDGR